MDSSRSGRDQVRMYGGKYFFAFQQCSEWRFQNNTNQYIADAFETRRVWLLLFFVCANQRH